MTQCKIHNKLYMDVCPDCECDREAAEIERLNIKINNERSIYGNAHKVDLAKIEKLEREIGYEQTRNKNNVAIADEQIKRLERELAELKQDYSNMRDQYMSELESKEGELMTYKEANNSIHLLIMQVRQKLNAFDTPTAPTTNDILQCIIKKIDAFKDKAELWDCLERRAEHQAEIPKMNYRLKYLIASIKAAVRTGKEKG